MEVIKVDKAGRLVIPKSIRERMGIKGEDHILLVEHNDTIILKKLDITEIAKKIEEELKGFDVEKAFERIREESTKLVLKDHPEIKE